MAVDNKEGDEMLGKIDRVVIAFFFLGIFSVVLAFLGEGGVISKLYQPTALLIVLGGTVGAVGVSIPNRILARIPGIIRVMLYPKNYDIPHLILLFRDMAIQTRKEGILSIENLLKRDKETSPFIQKGLMLIIDGTDNSIVRSSLDLELSSISERHREGYSIFESAGGYAPTMGIIGTVLGLISALSNLGGDPSEIGPRIAVAFIATFYGIASANLVWLPIASRLKAIDYQEYLVNMICAEAIILIQEGVSPVTMVEKLKGYLDHSDLVTVNEITSRTR